MLHRCSRLVWAAVAAALILSPLLLQAQDTPAGPEKALRYFKALQKRPSPGYLFDRFYNSWLDTGSLDELEQFLQATVSKSGATADRLLLAFLYVKQGENVRALQELRSALEADPDNADAWYQKALVEQRTLDFDTAIDDLDRALAANPKEDLLRDTLQLQGKLHLRNGDADKAKEVWSKLLQQYPGDEQLQEDIIELQISEGLFDEALETASALLANTKDTYLAVLRQLRIGDIHQRAGRRQQALEAYAASLEKTGHGAWLEKEIFAQIEQVYRREDDISGLKEHFQKLLEDHPKRIGLRRKLVEVLAELGEKEEATKAFAEILALTPGDRAIREEFVDTLAKLELVDKAIEQLQQLIGQHPGSGELLIKLAKLQHDNAKPEQARTTLEQYLEESDKSEYAHLRTARLLEQYQQAEAADATFQKLLTAFPESHGARDAYAAFLHKNDKKEQAVKAWRELAAGGDRQQVVRIARILATRNETQASFDLLRKRYEDFKNEPVYLTQLFQSAVRLEKYEEAQPWARQLVIRAGNPLDLESAVQLAARIAQKTESEDALRAELALSTLPQEICLLAELHERAGESKKAEAALASIVEKAPLLAGAQKIQLYRQRGDFEEAARAAAELVEQPGGRRMANVQRVVELFRRAYKLDEALKWIPQWKKLSPGSTRPWLTESRILSLQGKTNAAIETLRRATQQFDGHEEIRAALAQLYAEEGKLADASRMFMQLYEESEDLSSKIRWVQQLASAAEMQGKSRELIERFQERRDNNRQSIVPLLALAEIHRVGGNYEGRRQALMEASRLKADDVDLLLEIARIEEAELDYGKALATLEECLKLEESNRVKRRMARLHFNAGDHHKGFAILQEITGSRDADGKSVEQLAQAILDTGDWAYGTGFLAPARAKFPDNYRLAYLHAVALEEDGQDIAAIRAFTELLKIDKEMPAPALPTQQNNLLYNSQREKKTLASIAPKTTVELMMLSHYQYSAYQHRQQPRWRHFWPPMISAAVGVPIDLEQLHGMSLIHLMTLAAQVEPEDLDDTKDTLRQLGLGYADFIFEVDVESLSRGEIAGLLEDHGDNEAVLALAILRRSNAMSLEARQLKRAVDLFHDRYPELAYMAALSSAFLPDEDEAKPLISQAFELVKSIENPSYVIIEAILGSIGATDFEDQWASSLTEADKQKLTEQLLEWYTKIDPNDPWRGWIFTKVAVGLTRSEEADLSPFVRFLDDEIELSKGKKNSGSGSNRGLQGLNFPPDSLPGFPAQVLNIIGNPENSYYGLQVNLEEGRLASALEKARSPILKVLLTYHIDPLGEKTSALLKEMLEAKEPSLDAYLLAATHAAVVEGKPEDGVAILQRARYLPMTRSMRTTIDSSMVAWCLEAVEPADTVMAAGREATLRLRRAMMNPDQRQRLLAAMEQLGLTEEAEKFERKIAAIPGQATQGNSFSGGAFGFGSGTGNQGRIVKLISAGKKEQALKILARDLHQHSQNGLNGHSVFNMPQHTLQWLGQLAGFGLPKELLAHVEPGEDTNYRTRSHWAFACEVLGQKEKAIAAYQKILQERPGENGIRLRLIALKLESDPEAAAELIKGVSQHSLRLIANHLLSLLRQDAIPFAKRLALIERMTGALLAKALAAKKVPQLRWVTKVVQALAEMKRADGVSIGHLYAVEFDENPHYHQARKDEIAKMRERRRQVHDKICQLMLGVPELAREGFRRLSGLRNRDGADEKEILAMARAALIKTLTPTTKSGGNPSHHMVSFYDGNDRTPTVPMWMPEEYIFRYAFRQQNRDLIDKDILPTLEEHAGRTGNELVKRMKTFSELFFTPPSEFMTVAENYLKASSTRTHSQPNAQVLRQIVHVWQIRELEEDVTPLILHQIERSKDFDWSSHASLLQKLGRYKLKRGRAEFVALLDHLSNIFLGPEEKRLKRVKTHYVRYSASRNRVNDELHSYINSIRAMGRDQELFFDVYDYFKETVKPLFGRETEGPRPRHHPLRAEGKYRDVEKQFAALEATPFLSHASNFRFYPWNDSPTYSFFSEVADNLKDHNTRFKANYYLGLLKRKKTFGADFIATIIEDDQHSLDKFLATYKDAIANMPEAERLLLRNYIQEKWSSYLDENNLSKEGAQCVAYLRSLNDESLHGDIEKLLTAKSFREVGPDAGEIPFLTWHYVATLLPDQRQKAGQVFLKTIELMEQAPNKSRYVFETAGDRTLAGVLLEVPLRQRHKKHYTGLNFLYDAIGAPGVDGKLRKKFEMPLQEVTQEALIEIVQQAQGTKDDKRPKDKVVFAETLPKVAAVLDQKYWRWAVHPYFGYLRAITGNDSRRSSEIIPAIEAAIEEGTYQELAGELLFVAKLREASLPSGEPRGGKLAKEAAHAIELMKDPSIPLIVRIDIATSIVYHCGHLLPFHVTAKAVELVGEGWNAKEVIPEGTVKRLLGHVMDVKKTDEWKAAMTIFTGQWKRHQAMRMQSSQPGFDSTNAARMLEICTQVDDQYTMNYILSRSKHLAAGSFPVVLLRNVPADRLRRMVLRGWMNLNRRVSSTSDTKNIYYDEQIAEKLEPLLQSLENGDVRLVTEAFYLSLPDKPAEETEQEKLTPRNERLLAFAARVKDHEFRNPAARDAVLAFLSESQTASRKLKALYEKAAVGLSPVAWTQGGSNLSRQQLEDKKRIFQTNMDLSLEDGPHQVEATLAALTSVDVRSSSALTTAVDRVLTSFDEIWNARAKDWSSELRMKNAAVWTNVLKRKDIYAILGSDVEKWAARLWLRDFIESDGEAARKSSEVWDEASISKLTRSSSYASSLVYRLSSAWGLKKGKRLEIARALANDPVFNASLMSYPKGRDVKHLFERLLSHRLIQRKELLEFGLDLVRANPRHGYAAWELGKLQVGAKRETEAMASYDIGIKDVPVWDDEAYALLHLAKGNLMKKMGLHREASAFIETLDKERFPEARREELEILVHQLEVASLVIGHRETKATELALSHFAGARDGAGPAVLRKLGAALEAIGDQLRKNHSLDKAVAYYHLATHAYSKKPPENWRHFANAKRRELLKKLRAALLEAGEIHHPVEIIAKGAEWSYLADGSDGGQAWRQARFDSSFWKKGTAKLGYGEGNEATTVDFGPDSDEKFITTYFRRSFTMAEDLEMTSLSADIFVDDGAVIYVNGEEVARENMPEGTIDFTTEASNPVAGKSENRFKSKALDVTTVNKGENVIAVEVHQWSPSNPDLGFDLRLAANEITDYALARLLDHAALEAAIGSEKWAKLPDDLKD